MAASANLKAKAQLAVVTVLCFVVGVLICALINNYDVLFVSRTPTPLRGLPQTPAPPQRLPQYRTTNTNGSKDSRWNREGRIHSMSGYVIAKKYSDQLTQATRNLFQLAYISSGWNLKVVEPFVQSTRSGLSGMPGLNDHTLGEIYSKSALLSEMDKCLNLEGRNALSSFQEFLLNANRQFIVLSFLKLKDERSRLSQGPTVYPCNNLSLLPLQQELNYNLKQDLKIRQKARLKYGAQYNFRGILSICVNGWNFSLNDVYDEILATAGLHTHLQDGNQVKITIVIPEWRRVLSNSVRYYYTDPTFTWQVGRECDTLGFTHGYKVMHATESFIHSLNLHPPVLGIHLRIERLVESEHTHHLGGHYWRMCLSTFEKVVLALQRKYNLKASNMVAMHDFGALGTEICPDSTLCLPVKNAVLASVRSLGIRVVYYDPTRFGSKRDKTMAALVDMEFLIRSDYLLLLGWGGYHLSLSQLFQKNHHSDRALYSVCSMGPNKTLHHLPDLDIA